MIRFSMSLVHGEISHINKLLLCQNYFCLLSQMHTVNKKMISPLFSFSSLPVCLRILTKKKGTDKTRTSKVADDKLKKLLTSFPSGFLITTPSTTGDFLASACAYSGPTVYTYVNLIKKRSRICAHHEQSCEKGFP